MTTITIPQSKGLAGIGATIARLPRLFWLGAGLFVTALLAWALLHARARDELVTTPVVTQTLVQSVTASGTVPKAAQNASPMVLNT